jgi:hypothetical protein
VSVITTWRTQRNAAEMHNWLAGRQAGLVLEEKANLQVPNEVVKVLQLSTKLNPTRNVGPPKLFLISHNEQELRKRRYIFVTKC